MSVINPAALTHAVKFSPLDWVKRHPVASMILLLYLLCWPQLVAAATDSYGLTNLHLPPALDLLTGWGPGIAAFTITALVGGKAGVRELLHKMFRWRVGLGWYAVALFGSAAIVFSGISVYVLLSGDQPIRWHFQVLSPLAFAIMVIELGRRLLDLWYAQAPSLQALATVGMMFVLYMVFSMEEVAWRGFAQPRLQRRYGALQACLILWMPWTFLHLPYFFTKGSMLQQIGFIPFAANTLALTIIFAWLFNNTRGSVLLCSMLHASINAWSTLLPPTPIASATYLGFAFTAAAALLIVAYCGAARLSHHIDDEAFVY